MPLLFVYFGEAGDLTAGTHLDIIEEALRRRSRSGAFCRHLKFSKCIECFQKYGNFEKNLYYRKVQNITKGRKGR